MVNLKSMNYGEVKKLHTRVSERLKEFRPVHIKIKWKRCGKGECVCASGPSNGSWGNLHGPYVLAQFVDRLTRKTKVVSLGRLWQQDDINEARRQTLNWIRYFPVPSSEYEKMSADDQRLHYWYINVRGERFEAFHGISESEDRMDRSKRFYGTDAQHDGYETYQRGYEAEALAVSHQWCEMYGIGSSAGQKKLAAILADDYYLK